MLIEIRGSVKVMAETFGRKLVAIPSQRTCAFDSCLAEQRRFFFLTSRFLSLKVFKHASEILLATAFVDKNELTNVR